MSWGKSLCQGCSLWVMLGRVGRMVLCLNTQFLSYSCKRIPALPCSLEGSLERGKVWVSQAVLAKTQCLCSLPVSSGGLCV